jgi:hypothetical protein
MAPLPYRGCAPAVNAPPYLSVVVTARNDDHGANLLQRMQAFVNGLLAQCRRHELPAELIIVEWNPLEDRPRLVEVLHWPAEREFCDVRIIEVPNELHRRFRHWQALPLYQMIAKNVGIRRALGQFVLATNIDILFSDELMKFMAERRLERGKMYRVDRWDVMSDVPVDAPAEEQLAYCRSHLIRVNAREGTFRLGPDGLRVLETNDITTPGSGVSFETNWFPREFSGNEPFRWVDNDAELAIQPAGETERVLVLDVEPGPGVDMAAFLLELRNEAGKRISSVWVKRRSFVTFALPSSGANLLRVTLHVDRGGAKVASDPRVLNFRVFKCELETAFGVANLVAKIQGTAAVRTQQSWRSRAARGLRLLREIWRGDPDVQIRVPMSSQSLARLQLRQDGSGLTFSAEPLQALLRRRGRSGSPTDEEIVSSEVRLMWGSGWYASETHKGETFRWMRNDSTLVLFLPEGGTRALSLLVESGPALGFQPFKLHVRDQWGATLENAVVKGRTEVRIPLPPMRGAFVVSLHAEEGGKPKEIPGESRSLAVRVFHCGLIGDIEEAVPEKLPDAAPVEVGLGSGFWCSRGWTRFTRTDGGRFLAASREAELVLRVPEGSSRKPILEVEPGPASGGMPFTLVVQDGEDRQLYRGRIAGRQDIQISRPLLPGNYYVLRLRAEGPAESIDEGAPSEAPMLLLSNLTWTAEEAGEPIRIPVEPGPGSRQAAFEAAPEHLHTNACGDFTLIAREHWEDLRGYPEFDLFSMNIDSVFCWAAHHGGAREEILRDPLRIYHIEHGSGSGWTPEGQKQLFDRIAAKGLSWLGYEDVLQWARIMNRFDAPMIFNHDGWGMAADELKETRPWS